MLSGKINIGTPLKNLSCGDMTFGVYKHKQEHDNPILFIKDEDSNINSFSNTIGIKTVLMNIHSIRVVLIAVRITNKYNRNSGFVYSTHLNYLTDIGSRYMNSILRNPVITVSFVDKDNDSNKGVQTMINKDKNINNIVTRLNTFAPWSEENYKLCKDALLKSFPSLENMWDYLNKDNLLDHRSLTKQ